MPTPYRLHYIAGTQGLGEIIRLAFEEAAVPYVEVARVEEGGTMAVFQRLATVDYPVLTPFGPPYLEVPDKDLVIGQSALILHWIGKEHGLAPKDETLALHTMQLQLTINDLFGESWMVHHPIASKSPYEEQKAEAMRRAETYRTQRIPKFLGWFERALQRNEASGQQWAIGKDLSYVDLSLFRIMTGLAYAFPNALSRMQSSIPLLTALRDRVAARPRIAAYLASDRCPPYNDWAIFQNHPELDP